MRTVENYTKVQEVFNLCVLQDLAKLQNKTYFLDKRCSGGRKAVVRCNDCSTFCLVARFKTEVGFMLSKEECNVEHFNYVDSMATPCQGSAIASIVS